MSGLVTLSRATAPVSRKRWAPIFFAACLVPIGGTAQAAESKPNGTLMIVREWDPKTGDLVGWLPMHRATLCLTSLENRQPRLDRNEAVTIQWVPRSRTSATAGQVLVAPKPRVFAGERWLPLKRDSNVVRIARHLFLIRAVILGESKGRLPSRDEAARHKK